MTNDKRLPHRDKYLALWPISSARPELFPAAVRGASDRNPLASYLAELGDRLDEVDLDPYSAGYWMLTEEERRDCMGLFFEHVRKKPESLFTDQLLDSLEAPPEFDERYPSFIAKKAIYTKEERALIREMLSYLYEEIYADESWRYKNETLDFWSDSNSD